MTKASPEAGGINDSRPRKRRRWPNQLGQLFLVIGAIGAVVFFGALKKDAVVLGEVLAACFASLALLRFDAIKRFKGPGFEVEVFERLKRATREAAETSEEAKATIVQLRTLAATLAKLELDNLALRNRHGVLPPSALAKARDEVVLALGTVQCSADEIARALKLLDSSMRSDLCKKIENAAEESMKAVLAATSISQGEYDDFERTTNWWRRERRREDGIVYANARAYRLIAERFKTILNDGEARLHLENYERYEKSGEAPEYKGDANYFRPES